MDVQSAAGQRQETEREGGKRSVCECECVFEKPVLPGGHGSYEKTSQRQDKAKGQARQVASGTGITDEAHWQVTCGEEGASTGHTIQMAPLQPLRAQCGHVHCHWA